MWNPNGFYVTDRLLNDAQMKSDYFVTNIFIPLEKRSFLEERRCIKNNQWFISTIAQFTHVGVQQTGSKNMTCAACYTHPPYSPDLAPVTSTYFL
jgi:hypothetical protein